MAKPESHTVVDIEDRTYSKNTKKQIIVSFAFCNLVFPGILLFIAGCTVGPDYKRPDIEMPQQWPQDQTDLLSTSPEPNNENWWKIFHDHKLDTLIGEAVKNNPDVRIAVHRVETSRALLDFTRGRYYPTVDALGTYTRSQESKDGVVKTSKIPNAIDLHTTGLDFTWEIDLFGKIKRSVESSQASYSASIEDYRNVMVILLAELCDNYIDYRTTQARIAYARDNARIQRETLELTKNRYKNELVGEFEKRRERFVEMMRI